MTIGEISLVISITGVVPYILQILRGHVRPERMTWFVWTVILALAVWSYHASGATDSVWFLVGDLIVTAFVFMLAIWKGVGGWARRDVGYLFIAASGLLLWQLAGNPLLALCGIILADIMALLPTLTKALKDPFSESATTFSFSSVAALCGVVAVAEWNLLLLFYPFYLFLANFVTALVIVVGQYQVSRSGVARQAE